MGAPVTVLLFATARRATGAAELRLPVEAGGVPVRSLLRALGRSYPKLLPLFPTCRFALNGEYVASRATRVHPGDEFAIHPPYGGG
jgi:molybdopterin converting factor small subunit